MTEDIPNLMKEEDTQVQEAQRVLNNINPERLTPRHNTIKMAKFKDENGILKAARKRQ